MDIFSGVTTLQRRFFDSQEKRQWLSEWVAQGERTLSILRYTRTGEDPVAGIEGTPTLVTGLADMKCTARQASVREVQNSNGLLEMRDQEFVIYMPDDASFDTGLDIKEEFSFESKVWRVTSISEPRVAINRRVKFWGRQSGGDV